MITKQNSSRNIQKLVHLVHENGWELMQNINTQNKLINSGLILRQDE